MLECNGAFNLNQINVAKDNVMYYVAVTNHVGTYLYGPFDTRENAKQWADNNQSGFFGRTIHVINKRDFINPNKG